MSIFLRIRPLGPKRVAPVLLVMALGITGFVVTTRLFQRDRAAEAVRLSQVGSVDVQSSLADVRAFVASLGSVLAGESSRGQARFASLARGAAGSVGLIDALWLQSVPRAQRRTYEHRLGVPITRLVQLARPGRSVQTRFVRAPFAPTYLPASFTSATREELRPGVDASTWGALPAAIHNGTNVFAVSASLPGSLGRDSGFYLLEASDYGRGPGEHGFLAVFVPRGWLTRSFATDPRRIGLSLGGRPLEGGLTGHASASTRFQLLGQEWRIGVGKTPPTAWQGAIPWIALTWPIVFALLIWVVGRGILGRRRAEAEFERMFQVSRDLLWISGVDGSFRRVNPAFERTLGYSTEQMLSLQVDELVVPNDLGRVHDAITQLASGEEVIEFEASAVRSDGVVRRLELNARPIVNEGVFYGAARDVTERRRTERELAQLAQEHAALRRVATLVAQAAAPSDVLESVVREARLMLGAPATRLYRYDGDQSATVVAGDSAPGFDIPAGTTVPLEGDNIPAVVWRTGAAARIDRLDDAAGQFAARLRGLGLHAGAGAPIVVEGRLWGVLVAGWTKEIVPTEADPEAGDTEARLYAFTELVASAISNTEFRDGLRRLADEQAALRRVATLVAQAAPPEALFTSVTEELARLFQVDLAYLYRYDADNAATLLGGWSKSGDLLFPLGDRWPLEGRNVTSMVARNGLPARIDGYGDASGPLGIEARDAGLRSGAGAPIIVEGHLWGTMSVASLSDKPLPVDLEVRIGSFTDLMATAIANAESRAGLTRLADEQAALRRVATSIATGAPAGEVFASVAKEVAGTLDVPVTAVVRYESNGTATQVGAWGVENPFPIGTSWSLDDRSVSGLVASTGRPARVHDYSAVPGPISTALARDAGIHTAVGVPVLVDGRPWGVMMALSTEQRALPADTEDRLAAFTGLVATAISNIESRSALRALADEQVALRRVATLVAEGATADELFAAVVDEVAQVLDVPAVVLNRFDADVFTVVAATLDGTEPPLFRVGTSWPLGAPGLSPKVFETAGPVRIDDYSGMAGPTAHALRESFVNSSVGVPITVDGVLWGAMCVATINGGPLLPSETEVRLRDFTDLVGTAISDIQARQDLSVLAAEQASLRRVATLVAEGATAAELFSGVNHEVATVLDVELVTLSRYERDGSTTVLASFNDPSFPVGSRWPAEDGSIASVVLETGRAARNDDYAEAGDTSAVAARASGVVSACCAPITIDGQVWGLICVATRQRGGLLRAKTETRLYAFTELVALAVSNASTRSELIASRARIVAAGDDARRQIERNLHDGAQQRLIALGLDLQRIEATIPDARHPAHAGLAQAGRDVESVLEEVRELSRGLHPALLARGGLGPALSALARRSPIPVELDVALEERPPASIEAAVYYVVSEALTNAIKHSRASEIVVTIRTDPARTNLYATVADDGVGGAEPRDGSGLTGAGDRVDALGGRLTLESRKGYGTAISIELPIGTPHDSPAIAWDA